MRILITGARAPVALDWAHRLKLHGEHRIVMVDSVSWPIGRFSKDVDVYYRSPSPKKQSRAYFESILEVIKKEKIELIIPTCEEIFYLSKFKSNLPEGCSIFADDFEKLSHLHHKFKFLEWIQDGMGVHAPESICIQSAWDLKRWEQSHERQNYILKPAFSRFGSEVIFDLDQSKKTSLRFPVVLQKKLRGEELCSYSIVFKGELRAHTCYHPLYKAGPGAGVYFDPRKKKKIEDFVSQFSESICFTGQLAFDFFDEGEKIYVIDCNPRATSGLHLLSKRIDLLPALIKRDWHSAPALKAVPLSACQVKFGMWIYAWEHIKKRTLKIFIQDYQKAIDIYDLWDAKHLMLYQVISFLEIFKNSFKVGLDLKKAATEDIEWDGHEII